MKTVYKVISLILCGCSTAVETAPSGTDATPAAPDTHRDGAAGGIGAASDGDAGSGTNDEPASDGGSTVADGGADPPDGGAHPPDGGDVAGSKGCGVAHSDGFVCANETFNGQARSYCVDVRPGYAPSKPHAVVLGLHGCGGSPTGAHGATMPQVVAGANDFLFVYPKALGSCWAYSAGTVDTDYVRHVLDVVEQTYCIQPGRVFADGMSSGGMMVSRLASDGAIRAGAAISLNYYGGRATPMWLYGGTADSYFSSYIEPGRAAWVQANGCTSATTPLPQGPCVEYQGCAKRTIWCTDGGGHSWPSAPWTSQIIDFFRSVP